MKIGTADLTAVAVTDNNNRVITVITDKNTVITQGIKFLIEEKVGDIKFIPMEDGSVQAIYTKEGITLPAGAMTSEQFIEYNGKEKEQFDFDDIEALVNKIPPEQREKLISLLNKKESDEEKTAEEETEYKPPFLH